MSHLDLAGLTRYDGKIKEYIGGFTNWQKTAKSGAVACWPVGGTPLAPTVDFLFDETEPASGDKAPNNPSTITGVSSVKVTRCGVNLLVKKPAAEITKATISFVCDGNGSYTVNGTADTSFNTSGSSGSFAWNLRTLPDGTYTLFFKEGAAGVKISKAITNNGTTTYSPVAVGTVSSSVVLDANTTAYQIYFYGSAGDSYSNVTVSPCLCVGTERSAFEGYEGTDYTIALGNTYYGGSLDLATGTMTATHVAVTPDASTVDISSAPAVLPLDYTDTYGRTITSADGTSLSVGSAGGTVVYKLATPQTVQLSPVQISALTQTDKYTPRLNTIYSDQQAVQVGYAKSPARTEYELTQAIIATEGGE